MARRPVRLALLAHCPMYYHVPLYRRLARHPELDFTAIFASNAGIRPHDAGYGRPIVWDLDLLNGYKSVFLRRFRENGILGGYWSLRDPDVVTTLLSGKFDVLWLHGYNFLTHTLAVLTARAKRIPVLFREEQTLLHGRTNWKRALKAVGLPPLFAHGFGMYIGAQNRLWFKRYGIAEDRLFFVPYTVDNERLQRDSARLTPDLSRLRQGVGVGLDSGPVVLSVGRLIPKKQPLFLLEAYRRVRRHHRCALVFVGSGELENELRRKVYEDSVPDVYFVGFVNQSRISEAYAIADLFALVSKEHETWGLAVNEAMNFGLPIIVSDKVGSGFDLVDDSKNGFVVSSQEVADLASKLELLVTSKDLRKELGFASKQIISQWNYDVAATGVLNAVEAATGAQFVNRSSWVAGGV